MPALGADMDEGTLNEWLIKPGDTVTRGQIVAVVETTKAAVEIECWHDGVIGELLVPVGQTVAVGTPLATILDAGEAAGVLMPSGCRMGICMACVCTLKQGAVRDLRTGEVTVAEPGDELAIQPCISAVAGSADLEL